MTLNEMTQIKCTATRQKWPINGQFRISRGAKRTAEVIYVEIRDGELIGRGEAVPYGRYGETPKSVLKQVKAIIPAIEQGGGRLDLLMQMPAGAARNAIDSALWDIEAKRVNLPVSVIADRGEIRPVLSCYTISLDAPDKMAQSALHSQHYPLLKLKLGGGLDHDAQAMTSIRKALPQHRLVVDANEAWTQGSLFPLLDCAFDNQIELVEQPLPVDQDDMLKDLSPSVPLCADESFHTIDDIEAIASKYQAINIKTDKTGGLTHALAVFIAARKTNLKIMIGCMVGTSLAMAPAFVLAKDADWVDLDGPLLLAKDRDHGLLAHNGVLTPPERALWG